MKALAAGLSAAAITAVLWAAGEQHRGNCIAEGKQGCSVLPWVAGEEPPKKKARPVQVRIQRDGYGGLGCSGYGC